LGPWRASRIDVNISWPYQVENGREHGKWSEKYIIENIEVIELIK